MLASRHPSTAFDYLSLQIGRIDHELVDQLAIDIERGVNRFRLIGPVAVPA